ncbi:V-type ATP synthase subunit E [Aerococcus sanguinicola]|uniref:hypothetical protein n=1 Tax=unclassified Aerococcus TaxID=2618060 RepID=UPI0008A4EA6B|nr:MULTISPECIES: hypothetical protein [unclassified Aerococcus]MDK6232779.1 hypothetical protein [Aerococcus sp. UMB10185]MDK6805272.1 hypothetical protein [Aerococcus sp. UMB7834]MDK6854931.1 hypothetical protein [Aerococcus sp. UMB7533]MDK8501803.1 hypothetical protein [Aerococcus sp. UMB1112A]OFN02689.1 hypothetical protein HMPREF2626_01905 [Aerococcus sp. HMSC062A02]
MELNEKIDYFNQEVKLQVKEHVDEQVDQYRQTLEADFNEFIQKTDQDFDEQLQANKQAVHKEYNKEISELQIKQQRELYLSENKVKEALFKEFEAAIQTYKESPAYLDQLKEVVKNILDFAQGEKCDIYLDQSDANLQAELKEAVQHDITLSDRDFTGGIRGVMRERNILLDYSFSTLLNLEDENFTIKEVIN